MKLSGPIELIKKSIEFFIKKENFIFFLKIQSPLLIFAFVSFSWNLTLRYYAENLNPGISENPLFIGSGLFLRILSSIAYIFVFTTSLVGIQRADNDMSLSIKEAYKTAKERVLSFVLMSLLKGVALFVGFILFIIPGIIFSVWFAFSSFEAVLNKQKAKESLLKSKSLVKGRFWPVFMRLFVFVLFAMLTSIVFATLPFSLGTVISPIFGVLLTLPTYFLYQELQAQGEVKE